MVKNAKGTLDLTFATVSPVRDTHTRTHTSHNCAQAQADTYTTDTGRHIQQTQTDVLTQTTKDTNAYATENKDAVTQTHKKRQPYTHTDFYLVPRPQRTNPRS